MNRTTNSSKNNKKSKYIQLPNYNTENLSSAQGTARHTCGGGRGDQQPELSAGQRTNSSSAAQSSTWNGGRRRRQFGLGAASGAVIQRRCSGRRWIQARRRRCGMAGSPEERGPDESSAGGSARERKRPAVVFRALLCVLPRVGTPAPNMPRVLPQYRTC